MPKGKRPSKTSDQIPANINNNLNCEFCNRIGVGAVMHGVYKTRGFGISIPPSAGISFRRRGHIRPFINRYSPYITRTSPAEITPLLRHLHSAAHRLNNTQGS